MAKSSETFLEQIKAMFPDRITRKKSEFVGVLEIDHARGVIYFHSLNNGQKLLALSNLGDKAHNPIMKGMIVLTFPGEEE